MNNSRIPTILGIVVLVLGVAVGVFFIQQRTVFRLGASPDVAPQDVRVTNVGPVSFTVSWTTQKQAVGFVNWGDSAGLGEMARDETEAHSVHHVSIRGLEPQTNYYFVVNSAGGEYDNGGAAWIVRTAPALSPRSDVVVMSGLVLLPAGEPAPEILVYVTGGDMFPLSTKTSANGQWILSLTSAVNNSLSSYAAIDDNTIFEIFVQGGPLGIATAQTIIGASNPTPSIALGQSYDFRDATGGAGELPVVNLDLPGVEEGVTLESVDEGETIFTSTPEFSGEGPAGETITVTVESSHPISETVLISNNGRWNWSPPDSLAEGEHDITVSWTDSSGILQSITRSFVVLAQEADPTLTPSPTPTPSPSPTPTLKPSPIPTPTPSPTPPPLPAAGVGLPTVIGIATSFTLLVGAVFLVAL